MSKANSYLCTCFFSMDITTEDNLKNAEDYMLELAAEMQRLNEVYFDRGISAQPKVTDIEETVQ